MCDFGFMSKEVRKFGPKSFVGLSDLKSPPSELFVRGSLADDEAPFFQDCRRVGIVGTRAADAPSLRFAEQLAKQLSEAGALVISGGAYGIDAAAHRGALAGGGFTVAIVASSVRKPSPAKHRKLFKQVAEQGLLVCEFDDGAGYASRFLRRNQLIAAFSQEVVVVQAPARSGALSTARAAQRLGRRVLTLPASPWDKRSAGNLVLLKSGAEMLTSADEFAGSNAKTPKHAKASKKTPDAHLGDVARLVLSVIDQTPKHVDSIARETKLSVSAVSLALIELEVDGRVARRLGGYTRT